MAELITKTQKGDKEYTNFNLRDMEYNVPATLTIGKEVWNNNRTYPGKDGEPDREVRQAIFVVVYEGVEATAFTNDYNKTNVYDKNLQVRFSELEGQTVTITRKSGKGKVREFMFWEIIEEGGVPPAPSSAPVVVAPVKSGKPVLVGNEQDIVNALKVDPATWDSEHSWKGTFVGAGKDEKRAVELFKVRKQL